MAEAQVIRSIRDELKRTVRLMVEQLRSRHPDDHFYTVLLEPDVSQTYVIRIAGSDEALSRLCEKYVAKGYRVRSGDLIGSLRALLRWDAPGDDLAGWYWGDQADDHSVSLLIADAMRAGLIQEFDERAPLNALCVQALRELDKEGLFGTGGEREELIIGTTCCELDFGENSNVEELAKLNPPRAISRLRQELAAAEAADQVLIRPWQKRGSA